MKKIIILFAIMTLVLSGCSKAKTNAEQEELTEERIREVSEMNDEFTDLRFESELEWYNDFITPIKENNWNVSKEELESILDDVKEKREAIKKIDKEEIKVYLDDRYSKLDKDGEDKELKEKLDTEYKKIPTSLEGMNQILDIIENDIKLGLDGSFNSDDKSRIENSFDEIIKIYEDKIQ